MVGGFGQVEIALGVEDDGGGEDEGDRGGGDCGLRVRAEGQEQEDEGYPERSGGCGDGVWCSASPWID